MLPSPVVRGRKNPLYFGFPKRLARARRAAGLSHAALARLAGLASRTTTAVLESGESIPRVDTVERLALALHSSPCLLAFGLEPPSIPHDGLRCGRLAERLRAARAERKLSLRELGRRSGTSGSLVRQTEMGRSVPNLATVENLAKALGVSPAWLAYGEGAMEVQARGRTTQEARVQTSAP